MWSLNYVWENLAKWSEWRSEVCNRADCSETLIRNWNCLTFSLILSSPLSELGFTIRPRKPASIYAIGIFSYENLDQYSARFIPRDSVQDTRRVVPAACLDDVEKGETACVGFESKPRLSDLASHSLVIILAELPGFNVFQWVKLSRDQYSYGPRQWILLNIDHRYVGSGPVN
jgi:hypothetical protein